MHSTAVSPAKATATAPMAMFFISMHVEEFFRGFSEAFLGKDTKKMQADMNEYLLGDKQLKKDFYEVSLGHDVKFELHDEKANSAAVTDNRIEKSNWSRLVGMSSISDREAMRELIDSLSKFELVVFWHSRKQVTDEQLQALVEKYAVFSEDLRVVAGLYSAWVAQTGTTKIDHTAISLFLAACDSDEALEQQAAVMKIAQSGLYTGVVNTMVLKMVADPKRSVTESLAVAYSFLNELNKPKKVASEQGSKGVTKAVSNQSTAAAPHPQ